MTTQIDRLHAVAAGPKPVRLPNKLDAAALVGVLTSIGLLVPPAVTASAASGGRAGR